MASSRLSFLSSTLLLSSRVSEVSTLEFASPLEMLWPLNGRLWFGEWAGLVFIGVLVPRTCLANSLSELSEVLLPSSGWADFTSDSVQVSELSSVMVVEFWLDLICSSALAIFCSALIMLTLGIMGADEWPVSLVPEGDITWGFPVPSPFLSLGFLDSSEVAPESVVVVMDDSSVDLPLDVDTPEAPLVEGIRLEYTGKLVATDAL